MTARARAPRMLRVVTLERRPLGVAAECGTCAWARPQAPGGHWLAARAAARRHAASSGHHVRLTVATGYLVGAVAHA